MITGTNILPFLATSSYIFQRGQDMFTEGKTRYSTDQGNIQVSNINYCRPNCNRKTIKRLREIIKINSTKHEQNIKLSGHTLKKQYAQTKP